MSCAGLEATRRRLHSCTTRRGRARTRRQTCGTRPGIWPPSCRASLRRAARASSLKKESMSEVVSLQSCMHRTMVAPSSCACARRALLGQLLWTGQRYGNLWWCIIDFQWCNNGSDQTCPRLLRLSMSTKSLCLACLGKQEMHPGHVSPLVQAALAA